VRFLFGGLVCVVAGLIASAFRPRTGGLLLAFPAVLPASLTLIARHTGSSRSAGADALGSTFGAVGLAAFAIVLWAAADHAAALTTLLLASVGWLVTAFAGWAAFERSRRHRRQHVTHVPMAGAPPQLASDQPADEWLLCRDWHGLCIR
jgi:hypothetical protein